MNGQCKTLTVNINNLGINIIVKLRIDWDLTKLPDINQSSTFSVTDGEDIAKSVTKALKVKACTVCELRMKVIDSTSRQPLPDLDYWLTVSTNADW